MEKQAERFKVLVVEDDRDFARTVGEALRLDGCEVVIAVTGADAITRARESRPHAVLLDMSLPDKDGYAVARELRRDALDRNATIIVLTGAPLHDLAASEPPEIDLTLTKPTELDRLSDLLRHMHDVRARGSALRRPYP